MNEIEVAFSNQLNPVSAIIEINQTIAHNDWALLLFFCSSEYPLEELSAALTHAYPSTQVVGCTSAGELSYEGYQQNSITVIALNRKNFSVASALVTDLPNFSLSSSQQLIDQLLRQTNDNAVAPIDEHTFAITLLDGLSIQEEQFLKLLNANLGQIPLLGGSAGDDLHFYHTQVFYEGQFYQASALILLINTRHHMRCFSYHHLHTKTEKLIVTEANESQRRVYELNALPAATEYARVCGINHDQLNDLNFALHPMVVKVGDHTYARSVQKVHLDQSLSFYSAIESGMVLTKALPQNIVEQTQAWLQDLQRDAGEPELVLAFDCIFRSLEIEHLKVGPAMAKLFKQYKVAGFSTYGEQFLGSHLNHTLTGVYLGPLI